MELKMGHVKSHHIRSVLDWGAWGPPMKLKLGSHPTATVHGNITCSEDAQWVKKTAPELRGPLVVAAASRWASLSLCPITFTDILFFLLISCYLTLSHSLHHLPLWWHRVYKYRFKLVWSLLNSFLLPNGIASTWHQRYGPLVFWVLWISWCRWSAHCIVSPILLRLCSSFHQSLAKNLEDCPWVTHWVLYTPGYTNKLVQGMPCPGL